MGASYSERATQMMNMDVIAKVTGLPIVVVGARCRARVGAGQPQH